MFYFTCDHSLNTTSYLGGRDRIGGSNGAISSWTKFSRNVGEKQCATSNYIGHNLKYFLSNETNVARSLSNS